MTKETQKKIAAGLMEAMKAEHEGYHFYMMAARNCEDPKGKEVFERLAEEELDHVEFLKKQYKSIVDTGALDKTAKLGKPGTLSGSSPIFSEKIRERISDAHAEMTALSVGIQLELSARNYYSDQADGAQAKEIVELYRTLADWESVHYHALLAQQEELKEDYWSEIGFAPF